MEFYFSIVFCINSIFLKDYLDIIVDLLPSLFATIVSIVAIVTSVFVAKKSIDAKREDDKRKEIETKLNEFYGPFLQLRKRSELLYSIFVKKFKDADPTYRTLNHLLSGKKFEGNDKVLLEQIIEIGDESLKLINTKAGLIDDENLRDQLIPQFCNHLIILKLAYQGDFEGEIDRFHDYVYPQTLIDAIHQRFNQLQYELNQIT